VPAFALGLHHQPGEGEVSGLAFFYLIIFAEVYVYGTVAEQFDVGEAHHFHGGDVDGTLA
jgi:hypothetical protein